MNIGEKIKKLRKEQDITQEKLADYLNITCQAVSKWENGSALPDITLVVPLASFFGVSADVLFDLDTQTQEAELKAFDEEGQRLGHLGLVHEQITHWRKAVQKYPKNHHCLVMLAYALFGVHQTTDAGHEILKEAVSICERVLSDCKDTENRSCATQILVMIYGSEDGPMHDEEKAAAYAEKTMSLFVSREILLEAAYSGEKRIRQRHLNNLIHTDNLCCSLGGSAYGTPEERIICYETARKIYEAIFYDGNYLLYHCRIAGIHMNLARCYAKLQIKENALSHLKLSKEHAHAYDAIPEGAHHYTSTFLSKTACNTKQTLKSYSGSETDSLKNALQGTAFDFLREDADFIEFAESLVL
jgi:transcriptional regulator with XRE-family HTH domain